MQKLFFIWYCFTYCRSFALAGEWMFFNRRLVIVLARV